MPVSNARCHRLSVVQDRAVQPKEMRTPGAPSTPRTEPKVYQCRTAQLYFGTRSATMYQGKGLTLPSIA